MLLISVKDAADVVRLFHIIHPDSKSAAEATTQGITDDHRLISVSRSLLVHGQVTIIFVVSVCLSVCLFVCAEFFSAVFDPISIKLGHMLYVLV